MKVARDRLLGYTFIRYADPNRYTKFLNNKSNRYNVGQNQFLEDITTVYGMILNYKPDKSKSSKDKPIVKSDDDNEEGNNADASFLNNGLTSKNSEYYPSFSTNIIDTTSNNVLSDVVSAQHQEMVNFLMDQADAEPDNSGLDA